MLRAVDWESKRLRQQSAEGLQRHSQTAKQIGKMGEIAAAVDEQQRRLGCGMRLRPSSMELNSLAVERGTAKAAAGSIGWVSGVW